MEYRETTIVPGATGWWLYDEKASGGKYVRTMAHDYVASHRKPVGFTYDPAEVLAFLTEAETDA